jgi:mannosyltransferase
LSLLAGVLALAAVLRFLQLGHDSLWTDEGFSYRMATSGASQFLDQTTSADPNPPLYYILLRAWIELFGSSEVALRSLSAILGIALVGVVFELGRRLSGNLVGVTAALFTAVSSFLVHYSQEARGYQLFALLASLSYLCLWRLLERWSTGGAVAYALATTALLYTHVYAFFVLAAQASYLAVKVWRWPTDRARRRSELARWVGLVVLPVVLTAPWLVVFARHARDEVAGTSDAKLGWLAAPNLRDLPGALSGYAGSKPGLAVVFAVGAAAAVIAVRNASTLGRKTALGSTARRLVDDPRVALLVLWLLVPIVVPFFLSLTVTPFYQFKYTIPAALAFYLLVALGISTLGPRFGAAATALVAAALLVATVRYYSGYHTEQWREATGFLAGHVEKTDVIVFDSDVGEKNAFAYYWTRRDVEQLSGSHFAGLDEADVAAVKDASVARSRVWLVVSHSRDPKGLLPAAIEKSHRFRNERDFNSIRVLRFE